MKHRFGTLNDFIRRMLSKKSVQLLSVILVIFFPSHNKSATKTESQVDLEKRVDAVRTNLLDLSANSKASLSAKDNRKQLAQWYNWSNAWRNWYNGN